MDNNYQIASLEDVERFLGKRVLNIMMNKLGRSEISFIG